VQRERQHLVRRQRPAAADQAAQRRALEVLDEHVRVAPVERRLKAPQDHGVGERVERVRLAPQAAQGALVLHQVGPHELCHHDREQPLVPYEVDLVAVAASQRLQDGAPGGDLRPLE